MRGARRRPTRALVGLEVTTGVAIPFKKYLDFGSGQDTYFMDNGAGVAFAICLTLDSIELRYAYASLSTGRISGRIPDDAYAALVQLAQAVGSTPPAQTIALDAPSNLALHNLTFGYRLTFEPSARIRLAVPMGFGIVIAQPPDFGLVSYSLYGFGGHIGLLGELIVGKMVALGLDARLSIYVTEPDPNLSAAGYAATRNVFDSTVAWLPMLTLGVHARLFY